MLALLGESGSGKSVTLRSILRLHPPKRTVMTGRIRVGGDDVLAKSDSDDWRICAAPAVAMIFQEPMLALDPVFTHRPADRRDDPPPREHLRGGRAGARAGAVRAGAHSLARAAAGRLSARDVGRHAPARDDRARAVLPTAACCWPTSRRRRSTPRCRSRSCCCCASCSASSAWRSSSSRTIIGVAVEVADRIAVMYAGRIVESGSVKDVMRSPRHPYTRGLLASRVELRHAQGQRGCRRSRARRPISPPCRRAARSRRAARWPSQAAPRGRPDLASVGPGHDAACFRSDALV